MKNQGGYSLCLFYTGAAWLSSVRGVSCWVKSQNERNPPLKVRLIFFRDCQGYLGGRWGWRQVRMALMGWATHVLQWEWQKEATWQHWANPQKFPKFGLFSATREHEVGIASNRRSARYGEFVSKPCTHRPSHSENFHALKPKTCTKNTQRHAWSTPKRTHLPFFGLCLCRSLF